LCGDGVHVSSHQLPSDQWWLKLRALLRVLAKHNSVYRRESVDRDVAESTASEHAASPLGAAAIIPPTPSNFSARAFLFSPASQHQP